MRSVNLREIKFAQGNSIMKLKFKARLDETHICNFLGFLFRSKRLQNPVVIQVHFALQTFPKAFSILPL